MVLRHAASSTMDIAEQRLQHSNTTDRPRGALAHGKGPRLPSPPSTGHRQVGHFQMLACQGVRTETGRGPQRLPAIRKTGRGVWWEGLPTPTGRMSCVDPVRRVASFSSAAELLHGDGEPKGKHHCLTSQAHGRSLSVGRVSRLRLGSQIVFPASERPGRWRAGAGSWGPGRGFGRGGHEARSGTWTVSLLGTAWQPLAAGLWPIGQRGVKIGSARSTVPSRDSI